MGMDQIYDRIGATYQETRKQDPRIAGMIDLALGDALSVANVGAGTGSYEPADRQVLAVEPSEAMIAQRAQGSAPAIRARAERLPFRDKSFDAALAVNTLHHWKDVRAGLRELRRISRRRVVIFLRDSQQGSPFWLTQDYLPSLVPARGMARIVSAIEEELRQVSAVPVRLPSDCVDGLFSAYWARPEMYLDSAIRRNISNFALADAEVVARGIEALRVDIESGAWDRKHGHLRSLADLDIGHRLFVAGPV